MVKKIKSGVYGLNKVMGGGVNESSATVVIGSSGAGKTTLATQFLRKGLEEGVEGIYLTLDESPEQIIRDAVEMGWEDIHEYLDRELFVFIDASGAEFSKFIKDELADFVNEWSGAKARIVVDPLTPVMWASNEKSEQRELISFLLRATKKIGTVICTLEEHGTLGNLSGGETIIPMYLSDNVLHMKYVSDGDSVSRRIKVVKARSSSHSKFYHPYSIIKGAGIVVQQFDDQQEEQNRPDLFEEFKAVYAELSPEKLASIPKPVRQKIIRSMNIIGAERLDDWKNREIIDIILAEYDLI